MRCTKNFKPRRDRCAQRRPVAGSGPVPSDFSFARKAHGRRRCWRSTMHEARNAVSMHAIPALDTVAIEATKVVHSTISKRRALHLGQNTLLVCQPRPVRHSQSARPTQWSIGPMQNLVELCFRSQRTRDTPQLDMKRSGKWISLDTHDGGGEVSTVRVLRNRNTTVGSLSRKRAKRLAVPLVLHVAHPASEHIR